MNTFKTTLLMTAMTLLFLVVGQALGGQNGMMMAFVMAVGMNFFSYWFSDKMVLRMYRAKEVTEQQSPEIYSIVRELAKRGNLPMPKVYVIESPAPNAFATGRNPEHAAVAVTTGILQLLSRDELTGVLAHELSHVKNRDILISSIAATFAGAISMLAQMAQWGAMFGGRGDDDDRRGSNPMVLIVSMIVAPLAAMLIQTAISRSREYDADKGGAQLSGNPLFLASALRKLEYGAENMPMDAASTSTAHMFIVNPFAGMGGLTALFRTHPVTEERIRRLEEMALKGSNRSAA